MLNHIVNPRTGKAMGIGTLAADLNSIYVYALTASAKIEHVPSTGLGADGEPKPPETKPVVKISAEKALAETMSASNTGSHYLDRGGSVRRLCRRTPLVCQDCVMGLACLGSLLHHAADVPDTFPVFFRLAHGHDPGHPYPDISGHLPQFLQSRYTGCGEGSGFEHCKGRYTCNERSRAFRPCVSGWIVSDDPDCASHGPDCHQQPGMVDERCRTRRRHDEEYGEYRCRGT